MNHDTWDDFDILPTIDTDFESRDGSDIFESFKMEEYVPRRYDSKKLLLFCNIASGGIIVILVIIFIVTVTHLQGKCYNFPNSSDFNDRNVSRDLNHYNDSNATQIHNLSSIEDTKIITNSFNSSTNNNNNETNNDVKCNTYMLVMSDNKTLWTFDVKNQNLSSLSNFSGINIDTFEVFGGNIIFWSESNTSRIFSSQVDNVTRANQNVEVLLVEPRLKVQKMSFDWVGENLYIVDDISGCLIVINIQTKNYDILMCDLVQPHDIDLDPIGGLMFILQLSDSILRGNMDGSSLERIVISNVISAITLDLNNRRIYWVNKLVGIEISDYNGQSLGHLASDALNIIDLVIVDDQLFWLWLQKDSGTSIHHLLSCKIFNGTCEGHEMRKINETGDFKSIRVVNRANTKQMNQMSPCKVNNGDCQHLCLLKSDGKHSCTCILGWQLNPDKKTCREVKDFMLYTCDNYIRGRILDTSGNISVEVIWPTIYQTHAYKKTFFDYDKKRDNFYFSNGGDIQKMKLKGNWSKPMTFVRTKNYIKDLVYDWMTNNLFFIVRDSNLNKTDSLKMLNVGSNGRSEVSIICNCTSIPTDQPYKCMNALAIDPVHSFIFFASRNERNNLQIYRIYTNGTLIDSFDTNNDLSLFDKFRFMNIDYDEEKLFWIYPIENHETGLKRFDFNGNNMRTFFTSVQWAETINIYHQWIYLSNRTSIWRVDKKMVKTVIQVVPSINFHEDKSITDVRIIRDAL